MFYVQQNVTEFVRINRQMQSVFPTMLPLLDDFKYQTVIYNEILNGFR